MKTNVGLQDRTIARDGIPVNLGGGRFPAVTMNEFGKGFPHAAKPLRSEAGVGDRDVLKLHHSPNEIRRMTGSIHSGMVSESKYIDRGNFTRIGTEDLRLMFGMYDRIFFGGFFETEHPDKVKFRISKRMTSVGAKTSIYRDPERYVISLSTHLLFQTFADEKREITVNGITCHDRLEAAQRLFEHELIHVLEQIHFGRSSCSKPRFRYLTGRIFGHTDVTHDLITGYEVARERHGLEVGDTVRFDLDGKGLEGIITRITKRATVMVRNTEGEFQDEDGNSYLKYYVPLHILKPLGRKGF